MQPISPEALAFATEGAPPFVRRVEQAAVRGRKGVRRPKVAVSLDDFDDNHMLLYACLWYAYSCGVEVRLPVPLKKDRR